MNSIRIRSHLRTALKNPTLAVAIGVWLAAGTARAAPVNDDFASAIDLTGAGAGQSGDAVSGTQTGTNNADATLQAGEPDPGAANTVWFKWTSPADGNLTVRTLGSTDSVPAEWDAILGIHTGAAPDALTALGTTPQDTVLDETMTVPVTAGTTYHIQLAGYGGAVAANIVLNWNLVATVYQADILTFGPGAVIGPVVDNAATIGWAVPFGTDLATLAPAFTLSPGATCNAGGSPVVSGSPVDFTGGPVVFTVTAKGLSPTVNAYTVEVAVAPNESALTWNIASGGDWDLVTANWLGMTSNTVQPFANALNVIFDKAAGGAINIPSGVSPLSTTVSAPSGTYTFSGKPVAAGPLTKSGGGTLQLNVTPANFSNITVNGGTLYLFAAETGFAPNAAPFAIPNVTVESGAELEGYRARATGGTLTLNGGRYWEWNGWADGGWWGPVYLASDSYFGRSSGFCYAQTLGGEVSGPGGFTYESHGNQQGQPLTLAAANSYAGPTIVKSGMVVCKHVAALGNGGSLSISAGAKVKLDYTGEHNVSALTLGGVPQPGGTHGSTASGATYRNDNYFAGTGMVMVPASSEKSMLTFTFGALGAATIDDTAITLEVPFGTDRTNLAPTYTVSAEASGSPPSGTARNFTIPQAYTVTAQNLTTTVYTVTVTEAVLPDIFTWASAASGNWSVPAYWTNEESIEAAPLAGGRTSYTLNFTTPGTYTATNNLAAGFQLNQLNLGSAVTLDGNRLALVANDATLPTINQNGASQVTVANELELGSDTTFGGSGSGQVNLTGIISGTGSLTKNGGGVLTINKPILGNHTFSGGTIINSGQLRMNLEATLGTGPITLNDGTIFMWRFHPTNALIINGGKLLSENGFGNSLNGTITLNANLVCDVYYPLNITGNISGTGGLTKNIGYWNPILTLSGTNTYTGPTTVTAGTLQCNSVNAVAGGAWSISSGAKVNLNYAGTKAVASLTLGGVAKTAPGTYGSVASGATFQSDTYFTTGSTGTVTVGTAYSAWAALHAGGAAAPADGDFNNDGVDNGVAFFMGMNALATHPGVVGNSVTWPYANAVTSFKVQTSTDLSPSGWTDVLPGDPRLHVTAPGPSGAVSYDLLPPAAGRSFIRLLVTP